MKVAEGCDRACGFCAIPSFRGPQRSRSTSTSILARGRRRSRWRRSCSSPRTSPRSGATRAWGSGRSCRSCEAVGRAGATGPAALPLPVGAHRCRSSTRCCDTGVPVLRPLAPARVPAAAASHAPMGRRRPRSSAHRRHPPPRARRRLPVQLHRRLPRRDRGRPRRAAPASSRRPSSTGAASSPTRGRTAPTPPGSTARCPRPAHGRPPGRAVASSRTAITARKRDDLIGARVEVLVDDPGVGARAPRSARDRRHRHGARRSDAGYVPPSAVTVVVPQLGAPTWMATPRLPR